jgi:hypothetical protein
VMVPAVPCPRAILCIAAQVSEARLPSSRPQEPVPVQGGAAFHHASPSREHLCPTRAPLSESGQTKNQENGQTRTQKEVGSIVVIDRILTAMVTGSGNVYQPAVARASGQEEADLLLHFIASVKRQLPGQSTGEAFQKLTLVAASQIQCKAKRPQPDGGMEGHDFSMHHDSPIGFMTERCTSCDLERLVTRCGSKRSCQHLPARRMAAFAL